MSATSGIHAPGPAPEAVEAGVGRLLVGGTWLAMGLVLIGVVLLLAAGVDPLAPGGERRFDAAAIVADLVALRPDGFLWAGIGLVVLLPIARVAVAGLGFLAGRDWRLALVALAVLLVVALSIVAAIGLEA
jgi:uncharacterized membrane protein